MPLRNEASALLDELMGEERDAALSAKAKKRFWEKEVCKFYLVGLSPYQLLRNTRGYKLSGIDGWVRSAYISSIGVRNPSEMVCDINLRGQYELENEEERRKYGYERNLFDCLAYLIRQMDRRIGLNREKIAKAQAEAVPDEVIAQMLEIEKEIKKKIQASEELGESGEIEESMRLAHEAESLRNKKRNLETEALKKHADLTGQRFTVCQTTGELIECQAANDAAWMSSHIESDDFQAWKLLREWHANYAAQREGRGPSHGIPNYKGSQTVKNNPSSIGDTTKIDTHANPYPKHRAHRHHDDHHSRRDHHSSHRDSSRHYRRHRDDAAAAAAYDRNDQNRKSHRSYSRSHYDDDDDDDKIYSSSRSRHDDSRRRSRSRDRERRRARRRDRKERSRTRDHHHHSRRRRDGTRKSDEESEGEET